MTLFQNYSTIYSYNDFCDGATHLGENESEMKNFKIFPGKLKFFVDLDFFRGRGRWGRRRSIFGTAKGRLKRI